ncbi:MAG: cation diffusion facilitator family transporter [Gammaproteobacteria bacterium]|nr:cation diffusion facilitator family transporter [Gammaproteobacteria bacterium]
MDLSLQQRKNSMDKATWWGIIVNLVLAIGKLIIGFFGHSQALVADGLHSLSDLISDGLVLLATHHASADADEDHPYGHARYETLATIALGVLLIAVGIGISIDAVHRILNPEHLLIPSAFTLWIAGLSIASKEVLYQYTAYIARQVKSKLLHANAWHHRTDAISSIVVFFGIIGAINGIEMLDAIAAVIVALMIIKIGWELSHNSVQELVDTALEPDTVDAIKQHIMGVDGVLECHMLRTRRMGHNALVDVHILVNSKLSVSEGHQISEAVEYSLISDFEDINDVTVHIDPEDDEHTPNSCKHLPLRNEIINQLKESWVDIPETQYVKEFTLHYLDGMVSVEVKIPFTILTQIEDALKLQAKIQASTQSLDHIRHVNVCFTHGAP